MGTTMSEQKFDGTITAIDIRFWANEAERK
jgi:hypothetical protein